MLLSKDDILTIKAVLLYIIKHSDENKRDVYSIVKTAYYAQAYHFADWALPLYKDTIVALRFGPVPSNIYNILKMARGDEREVAFHNADNFHLASDAISFSNEVFIADEEPDMDYLSESDIESLDKAIEKISTMSFDDIVHETHSSEWEKAFKSPSSHKMDNINIARERGAPEDVIQYLREQLSLSCS